MVQAWMARVGSPALRQQRLGHLCEEVEEECGDCEWVLVHVWPSHGTDIATLVPMREPVLVPMWRAWIALKSTCDASALSTSLYVCTSGISMRVL